jgi:hypothetical protein
MSVIIPKADRKFSLFAAPKSPKKSAKTDRRMSTVIEILPEKIENEE